MIPAIRIGTRSAFEPPRAGMSGRSPSSVMRPLLVANINVVRSQDHESSANREGIDPLGIEQVANQHDQRKPYKVERHDNHGRCKPQRIGQAIMRSDPRESYNCQGSTVAREGRTKSPSYPARDIANTDCMADIQKSTHMTSASLTSFRVAIAEPAKPTAHSKAA